MSHVTYVTREQLDERLLGKCVRALTRGHLFVTRRERTGQNTFFAGKSFDDVMAENGVDFDRDRGRYLAYERAARAQMYANLRRGR